MNRLNVKLAVLALALTACFLLTGCSESQQPENQAFALCMSLDRTEQGLLEMCVIPPEIKGGDSGNESIESSSSAGASAATPYRVIAAGYADALDLLESTLPRTLNLSQLKLIVFSEQIAAEPGFGDLLEDLMLTDHLNYEALVVISQGGSNTFIKNLTPKVGDGLSSELTSSIEHYAQQGYVRIARLADIYYALHSIYGDPTATLGAVGEETADQLTLPPGMLGDALPGALPSTGPIKVRLMGSALIMGDAMVGVLDGAETRWLQVLTGNLLSFNYVCQGQSLRITIKRPPSISVDVGKDPVEIRIGMDVVPSAQRVTPDLYVLEQQMRAELNGLLSHCQSLGVDPIGFAEYAARRFPTYDDFERFNWRQRFQNAAIDLDIRMTGAY